MARRPEGPPGTRAKRPIAGRAPRHPEAGAGRPVEHNKAEERSGARGVPAAVGCAACVARAASARSGPGKFVNSGLCGRRLAAPEGIALQGLPPGRVAATSPPPRCKMLRHRPGKETPAPPRPGAPRRPKLGFLRPPFSPLAPTGPQGLPASVPPPVASSVHLCPPRPPWLSSFFPTLPDPNSRGRSSGRWREVTALLRKCRRSDTPDT